MNPDSNTRTCCLVSEQRGKCPVQFDSNIRNRPPVSDHRLRCRPKGNHRCRSLPYKSGQAVCREPHQESGLIDKALFQAEVTRQGTEHNTMSPARQPTVLIGHILCHVLQQGVLEINTTWEACVDHVIKTGRAAKSPKLALRALFKTIVGDVPFKGTPPQPLRAEGQ